MHVGNQGENTHKFSNFQSQLTIFPSSIYKSSFCFLTSYFRILKIKKVLKFHHIFTLNWLSILFTNEQQIFFHFLVIQLYKTRKIKKKGKQWYSLQMISFSLSVNFFFLMTYFYWLKRKEKYKRKNINAQISHFQNVCLNPNLVKSWAFNTSAGMYRVGLKEL